jgi:hypothetical protein
MPALTGELVLEAASEWSAGPVDQVHDHGMREAVGADLARKPREGVARWFPAIYTEPPQPAVVLGGRGGWCYCAD